VGNKFINKFDKFSFKIIKMIENNAMETQYAKKNILKTISWMFNGRNNIDFII
jgi:hypothetical protein